MGYARHIGRVGGLAVALGVGLAVATTPGVASAEPGAGSASSSDTTGSKSTSDSKSPNTSGSKNTPDSNTSGSSTRTAGAASGGNSPADDDSGPERTSATTGTPRTTRTSRQAAPETSLAAQTNTSRRSESRSEAAEAVQDRSTTPPVALTTRSQSGVAIAQAAPTVAKAPAPQPATPTSLARVRLAPLTTDTPPAPAETPALLAMCEWCRRENTKSLVGESPTTSGQTVDISLMASPAASLQKSAATPQVQTLARTVAAKDTTAPTVNITAPTANGFVAGTVTLRAAAADNVKVTGVQFLVNGTGLGSEDTTSPYSVSWNTKTVANGPYTLTARARDAAGNARTSVPVTVIVDNAAPTVSLTAPTANATVSRTVTLNATAADNAGGSGVAGVQFLLNGAALGAEDTTAGYSVSWDTTTAANATYALSARVRDAAGNTTTSAPVTVTVANIANRAPVVPGDTIPRTFDPVTGIVTGVVNVQDPDNDALTYTLAEPPSKGGTVSFNQQSGAFSYQPSQPARDQAAATQELDYDTFGVAVSDGTATVHTTVTVQVAPTLPSTVTTTTTPVSTGIGPSGVAVSNGNAYVINYDSNNVTVIDTATNQVVKTLDVGAGPLSVAATPGGNRVYVTNSLSNSVSVINTNTNEVVGAPIAIPVQPGSYENQEISYEPIEYPNRVTEIAASSNRLYVDATDGNIYVVDTAGDANRIVATAPLGTFTDLKVSPDGTRLYGTSGGGLTVINTATMTPVGISVGPTWDPDSLRSEYTNGVGNVAVSPDGNRAYVTYGATIAERAVGGQPYGSFFTDSRGVSWMITGGYSAVAVIDTNPTSTNYNKQIATVVVPLGVQDLTVSGGRLYVTSGDGKSVTVINTANNALVGTFTTDQTSSGGRAIYIPDDWYPLYNIAPFTRYIAPGPTGTLYVTDYTDGKAYAVTVGTSPV